MADESTTPAPQAGRNAGSREGGGFRIRLSDNEMRAARSIQEAFRLRSTVAVLGFSVRTVAQLLEEGKLADLVAQQQSQPSPRAGGRGGDSERRDGARSDRRERPARVDPFARPSRPAAAPEPEPEPEPATDPEPAAEAEASADPDAPAEEASSGDDSEPTVGTPAAG